MQEFGRVNYAAWHGDGVSSGLLGFAYQTLTSMYEGENPKLAKPGTALKYNPFFDNLYESNTTAPVFSMALTRETNYDGTGGLMGLGGYPNVPFSPSWITVPILPVGVDSANQKVYQFYSVTVDGFSVSSDQSAMFAPSPRPGRIHERPLCEDLPRTQKTPPETPTTPASLLSSTLARLWSTWTIRLLSRWHKLSIRPDSSTRRLSCTRCPATRLLRSSESALGVKCSTPITMT
jgi:hypothetical protein